MIKWEQPEESAHSGGHINRWDEVVEYLKDRPNEWALVLENDSTHKARSALVKRGCEVTARGVNVPGPGKAEKIYARYIGEDIF